MQRMTVFDSMIAKNGAQLTTRGQMEELRHPKGGILCEHSSRASCSQFTIGALEKELSQLLVRKNGERDPKVAFQKRDDNSQDVAALLPAIHHGSTRPNKHEIGRVDRHGEAYCSFRIAAVHRAQDGIIAWVFHHE